MGFYERLNYSLGNEDWAVEEQALQVAPGDRAVCVTASGDRPLHLLLTDAAEIVSIDLNPVQTYLLDLKLAALAKLDFEQYLAFLGCSPTTHRLSILRQLKHELKPESAAYWEKNKKLVKRGIIYQGRTERLTNLAAFFIKLFRRNKVSTLFSFDDLESQREFMAKEWNTKLWNKSIAMIVNTKAFKSLLDDPGLKDADYKESAGYYIFNRMNRCLDSHLAKKCALLQLFILGKVLPDAYFPYLTYAGYSKIRQNLGRITFKTGNIVDMLHKEDANSFDCFSLSDIASYMTQDNFEKLLQGAHNSAKPNARFCMREFMSSRVIPATMQDTFKRNTALEQKLELEDSNFIYRFIVGHINKTS